MSLEKILLSELFVDYLVLTKKMGKKLREKLGAVFWGTILYNQYQNKSLCAIAGHLWTISTNRNKCLNQSFIVKITDPEIRRYFLFEDGVYVI